MKTARTSQTEMPAEGLPQIPDYPEAPLSGWKHYGIFKEIEQKIHDELTAIGYDGRLVGLRVSYHIGSETPPESEDGLGDEYSMSFGYNVDNIEEITEERPPLSEEFTIGLYDFANDLIANNISPYVPSFVVRLDIACNPFVTTYSIMCRICKPGECTLNPGHEGSWRRMISINNSPWRCLHSTC